MQKNSKVDIRKKDICITLYGSKFLVSECVFKLAGDQKFVCARDIAKRSMNGFLLLLILKSSYPRCTVEKGVLKNFTNFKRKHLCWSLF